MNLVRYPLDQAFALMSKFLKMFSGPRTTRFGHTILQYLDKKIFLSLDIFQQLILMTRQGKILEKRNTPCFAFRSELTLANRNLCLKNI